jgi:D-alanine transfer protein
VKKTTIHLISAPLAILIIIGFLACVNLIASFIEQKYINILAPRGLRQAFIGSVLQEAALKQPDLLPVYGTSEIYNDEDENSADQFFKSYPTGFNVIEVASGGISSLEMAENLAALGPELKGKKVVISFTPTDFEDPQEPAKSYAGEFSRLHANELVFNPYISYALKQRFAVRMLDYPKTLANDPLLAFALKRLDSSSPLQTLLFNLTMPVGQIQTQVIRLQDHWAVLSWMVSHPKDLKPDSRNPDAIDWNAQLASAERLQSVLTSSNPYGITNNLWETDLGHTFGTGNPPGSEDPYFIHDLSVSKEWEDFDILLSVLKETGAQPLILGRPFNGPVLTALGDSAAARQVYYYTLQKEVKPYGFPLVDFADQDTNPLFSVDEFSHTSRVGWVYVDQALDSFYRGNLH